MNLADLSEEVAIELEQMQVVVDELSALHKDVTGREPTLREKTAAAAFLAQFYNRVENILKRISGYYQVELPAGETWYIELFRRFCSPSMPPLPTLFDESLAADLSPYRRFRHVVLHSYGFQVDWLRMSDGIARLPEVFLSVKESLADFLQAIGSAT